MARKPPSRKSPAWPVALGVILLLWFAVNTGVGIARYGLSQGVYWWFCNLALFGVGAALVGRHRGWIAGWLAIASFTQTFWIFDNLWRISTGENFFGLVEFMYQPGNPMDEFLLSHYHFFILPSGVLGLLLLKEKKNISHATIVATNAFIFGMSYFAFPKEQNVNCIHEPCLPSIEHWGGPLYAVLFSAAVCAGCVAVYHLILSSVDRWKRGPRERKLVVQGYVVTCVLAVGLTAVDIREKFTVPGFRCDSVPAAAGEPQVSCGFTLEHAPKVLAFTYRLENPGPRARQCNTYLDHGKTKELLEEDIVLGARERMSRRTLLAYPEVSVVARLSAECRPE